MPLITPPFRTSLLTANGVPFATDNGDIQTTRDWWLYWNQLTDRSNANSKLATAGTHGDRPMPESMPDGALYYENDRGVLYASTLGVWQYVAGTMYGTLSPVDERPTDLGTHDAGFDFRTIVAPAREFLWSQAEWIETTPGRISTQAQPGRVLGTTYQNTNATPLFAAVSCRLQYVGGFCQINAYTDSASPPGQLVAQMANFATGADIAAQLFFVVLPNNYYRVVVGAGTGTLFSWTEWF